MLHTIWVHNDNMLHLFLAGFPRQDIYDIHCFWYKFNFKEVIRDGHKLSVKCCNNQHFIHSLLFMDSLLLSRLALAVVKASAFVEANQLIAHQTMNVIYVLSTENPGP